MCENQINLIEGISAVIKTPEDYSLISGDLVKTVIKSGRKDLIDWLFEITEVPVDDILNYSNEDTLKYILINYKELYYNNSFYNNINSGYRKVSDDKMLILVKECPPVNGLVDKITRLHNLEYIESARVLIKYINREKRSKLIRTSSRKGYLGLLKEIAKYEDHFEGLFDNIKLACGYADLETFQFLLERYKQEYGEFPENYGEYLKIIFKQQRPKTFIELLEDLYGLLELDSQTFDELYGMTCIKRYDQTPDLIIWLYENSNYDKRLKKPSYNHAYLINIHDNRTRAQRRRIKSARSAR